MTLAYRRVAYFLAHTLSADAAARLLVVARTRPSRAGDLGKLGCGAAAAADGHDNRERMVAPIVRAASVPAAASRTRVSHPVYKVGHLACGENASFSQIFSRVPNLSW